MKNKTKYFLLIILLSLLALTLGACKNEEEKNYVPLEEDSLPLGRYEETLNLTIGQMVTTNNYVDGEKASDNVMYNLLNDLMNIKIKSQFSAMIGSAYDYQLNLAMVNDNLPDMFFCSKSQLSDLIEQEMVADLSEAYNKYASPALRLAMEYSYTGDISVWNNGNPTISKTSAVLDTATYDGKLYGIPFLDDLFSNCPLMWLRLDWLKEYAKKNNISYTNEQELLPKNFQEYLNLVDYFANGDPDGNGKKDTFGMSLGFNAKNLQGIANVYGAYPGYYLLDENGKYIYGTEDEKLIPVLEMLRGYYNNEVIDKNSALDGQLLKQALASGTIGSFLGEYWSIMSYGLGDAYLINQTIDWIPWAIRDFDGNVIKPLVPYNVSNDSFYCIREGFNNPEVVIIFANHMVDRYFSSDGELTKKLYELSKEEKYKNVFFEIEMYSPFRMDAPNKNIRYAFDVQKALKTNDTSFLSLHEMMYYDRIIAYQKDPTGEGKMYYPFYKIFADGGAYSQLALYAKYDYEKDKNDLKVNFVRPSFYKTSTSKMKEYGSIISDYEYQELVYMFTGKQAIDSKIFNTFVNGLETKGMKQILEELNKK